jgi:hypothetical protein
VDRDAARSVLLESLARPSGTPSAWREDPDAYIKECKVALLAQLIEPRPVQAEPGEYARKYIVGSDPQIRSFVALARCDDTWLLLDPNTLKFFKAFGSNPDERPLGLLEFGSDDALLEWIG